MNPLDLTKHLKECIAVLSALGQSGMNASKMTFYEDSIKSVVSAMRNAKIKRLICMTSFYTKCRSILIRHLLFKCLCVDQPEKYPATFKDVIRPMIGSYLDSMFIMEQYLEKECHDIDYSIVRPPYLLDDRIIGKLIELT
jgi:hypothetical protein